jgi:hypothetical protein
MVVQAINIQLLAMLKPIKKDWRYTCPRILKLGKTPIMIK